MSVVYTDLQELASEFATLTQERIDPFIARAERRCNADYYGDLLDDAVLYLAAHLLAEAQRAKGEAGPVTSRTAGPLSVSFAASAGVPSEYGSTRWGVEHWRILQACYLPMVI